MGSVVSTSKFLDNDSITIIPYQFDEGVRFTEWGGRKNVEIFPWTYDSLESKKIEICLGIGSYSTEETFRERLATLAEISCEGRII